MLDPHTWNLVLTYCLCLHCKTNNNNVGWGFSYCLELLFGTLVEILQRCVAVVLNGSCVELKLKLQGLSG